LGPGFGTGLGGRGDFGGFGGFGVTVDPPPELPPPLLLPLPPPLVLGCVLLPELLAGAVLPHEPLTLHVEEPVVRAEAALPITSARATSRAPASATWIDRFLIPLPRSPGLGA